VEITNSFILNNKNNTAVKALIYRTDGKILMQQRDIIPGLPFGGHWSFFGGLMEDGETPVQTLERELKEELGCIPGVIEHEVFTWTWQSDWVSTVNHCYALKFVSSGSDLELHEGNAMQWVPVEDIITLPVTPAIYENYSAITTFIKKFCSDVEERIEEKFLLHNDLVKKNERVFYAKQNPCVFSRQQMYLFKELAVLRHVAVCRICLHTDDSADVHEMLMVHTRPVTIGPLKQDKTSLSYHIIEGYLRIDLHDDQGNVIRQIPLGKRQAGDYTISSRLQASQYRSVHSMSSFAIFLEVGSGPFQDNDTHWLKINKQQ
jgi:8-oxo-dGTP diphosphatase